MKLALVQLSDIHFKNDKSKNFLTTKLEKIIYSINSNLHEVEKVIIIMSGDTAYSGNNKEYEVALDFYSTLLEGLKHKNIEFLLIPGNHDCDFSQRHTVRETLKKNSEFNDLCQKEIVEQVISHQKNYFEFEELFQSKSSPKFADNLFKQYRFEIKNESVQINLFNTAWLSEIHEKSGDLFFPINNYTDCLSTPSSLSISVLHHPTHWLEPNNKREVDLILQETSDLILTGHEHTSTNKKTIDFNNSETIYFEGAALQTDNENESAFNVFIIDLKDQNVTKNYYTWDPDVESYKELTEFELQSFSIYKTQKRNGLYFSEHHRQWLSDPGLMVKHPKIKKDLDLIDLYVYPDAELTSYDELADSFDKIINLKDLLNFEKKKIMLIGSENYGKTSYCKVYIKAAFKNGYLPIKLEGNKLNSTSIKDINKLVFQEFKQQYENEKIQRIEELDSTNLILIIDNIHNSRMNSKNRIKLLDTINNYFERILVTSRELIKYEELLIEENDAKYKDDFYFVEILPFGNVKKGELILSWNRLGENAVTEEFDIIKKVDKCEKIINTVLGNNYVPSLPFFIITILQTIESGDSNIKDSAYGFYYDYLIKNQLITLNLSNENLIAFNNYISHLAFYAFNDKKDYLSSADLIEFHKNYICDFGIEADFETYMKLLLNASILINSASVYNFKFKYIYYYFVAKYLADDLESGETETLDLVKEMSSKLYVEEYSNIIMFLSYHSKNPVILYNVLENAKKIFKEVMPSALENEITPLNKLVVDIPKLVIDPKKDVFQERKQRLEKADELERIKKEDLSQNIPEEFSSEDEETFDMVSKINWAMKTLEIMGQILKNYFGSTKKDKKVEMGREVYLLSLRSLGAFLNKFVENQEQILLDLERIIKQEAITSDEKIKSTARNFIFGLTSAISIFFIKKVSSSAGTHDLLPIFKEINDLLPVTSVKLIDISIKLDHMYDIPFSEIESLLDVVGDNPMVITILRKIVINHIYMFPVDYRDRQKVVDLLSLNQKQIQIGTVKKQQYINN